MPLSEAAAARWTDAALRIYRRYQHEIVEDLGLCPWAVRARVEGRMQEHVLLQTDESIEPTLQTIDALAADPHVEVAVTLYPRLALDPAAFEAFATRVRDADQARRPLGQVPFVIAVFHPVAHADATHAERLVPFLRRTPDPTLQLLRSSVLDRVRDSAPQGTQFIDLSSLNLDAHETPPLRERIARTNLATAQRVGIDEMKRRLDEIRSERDRVYGALAADRR